MYCPNCGKEVADISSVCVSCGTSLENAKSSSKEEKVSAGWWWLGFFIPLAGFLIWGLCSDTPKKARKAGIGAIVGTVVSIVLVILFYVLYFILIFWLASEGIDSSVQTLYYI